MSANTYHVREVIAQPRLVAAVRAVVPRGHVGREFGRSLDQVYAAGRAGAVALDGQNIFIYRSATATELTVDFSVGATSMFEASGAVVPMETPSGPAALTTHIGAYGGIADANAAIIEWCEANGRKRTGPSWEVYGHWDPDVSKLRTDIYYLLEPRSPA